ncbi:bacteriohemerythrin [Magnetospira sp. QH-2]|uniref:bacteriohemerythrin n=1 Tax=Magnetospira sp. (strain QH-2) TaxID=1288970 RepID=UPI0003E8187A|nr:hemerythrin family protein [Magnetospira sp. QH-2]CCQ72670.1 putative Bacteriohemerythrin [Magnetospira sp. QH-2]
MPRFVWKDDYKIGDAFIDQHHRQLIELGNYLHKAVHEQKDLLILQDAFNALLLYTQTHFRAEEEYFDSLGCPIMEEHKKLHRELEEEAQSLCRQNHAGFQEMIGPTLENWMETRLVRHMVVEDKKLAEAVENSFLDLL